MPDTFEAILRGDRLEWVGAAPPPGEVRVRVTVTDDPVPPVPGLPFKLVPVPGRTGAYVAEESLHLTDEERGRLAAEALARLATHRTPQEWAEFKREWLESRKDRVFPGRED